MNGTPAVADSFYLFPSPCGEKVGINLEAEYKAALEKQRAFPSPCGEKVGINRWVLRSNPLTSPSFRPLAGKR